MRMFEGGQDEGDGHPPAAAQPSGGPIPAFKVFTSVKESREDYLQRAKFYKLSDNNIDAFFNEEGLSYSFGVQTEHLMRLGFDEVNNVWKVFIKRENCSYGNGESSKPSILGFLLWEMDDVVAFLETSICKIEEGLANKRLYLKPDTLVGWKLEQPTGNIEFWTADDIWYSDSGTSRISVMWQLGNVYITHLNQVREPGPKHPHNYGPKLRLSRKEVADFMQIYNDIIEMTGPAAAVK